jgi:hypothetical protein
MFGPRIIFSFWLGLGLLFLGLTFYFWSDTQSFLGKAVPTAGTVLQMEAIDDEGSYAPVVGFQTLTGQKIEYHSNTSTNPPAYKVGDKVNVLYDPANSSNVRINDFISLWLLVLILGIMGSIFTAIGVLGLVFTIPMRHRVGLFVRPKQVGVGVSSSWSSNAHPATSNENRSTNGNSKNQSASSNNSSKNHSTTSNNKNRSATSSKKHSTNGNNKNRSATSNSKNHSTTSSSYSSSADSSTDSSFSWGIDASTDSSTSSTFSWSSSDSSSSDFSAGGGSSDWGSSDSSSSSSSDFSAGGGDSSW